MKPFVAVVLVYGLVISTTSDTYAASATPENPVVEYIWQVRFAYGSCSQKSQSTIVFAQLKAATSDTNADYDFTGTRQCRAERGAIVTEKLKAAQKFASKNKQLSDAVNKLQRSWIEAMSSSTIPGGSDTTIGFDRRVKENNRTLKEVGNMVLSVFCKDDFACVDEHGGRLSVFDQWI